MIAVGAVNPITGLGGLTVNIVLAAVALANRGTASGLRSSNRIQPLAVKPLAMQHRAIKVLSFSLLLLTVSVI